MRTTLVQFIALSLIAAALPAAALADNKTDTIKGANFPGGFHTGDRIRATFTMTGSGSGTYDRIGVVVEGPNNGPLQVTFDKPPTAATIMYMNLETSKSMSTIFTAAAGDPNIIDIIRVGDIYPIFAAGSLSTLTDVSLFVNDSSITFGQSFDFVNGVCSLLPGTTVLDNDALYTGSATVTAVNEVGFVPTPGSIALLGAGALISARRRRASSV